MVLSIRKITLGSYYRFWNIQKNIMKDKLFQNNIFIPTTNIITKIKKFFISCACGCSSNSILLDKNLICCLWWLSFISVSIMLIFRNTSPLFKNILQFSKFVFYVNCKQLQSQMQRFSGRFIWNTWNGEKPVIQGLSESNGGAGKARRLSAMFVKIGVRSLKRLVYKLWIRT